MYFSGSASFSCDSWCFRRHWHSGQPFDDAFWAQSKDSDARPPLDDALVLDALREAIKRRTHQLTKYFTIFNLCSARPSRNPPSASLNDALRKLDEVKDWFRASFHVAPRKTDFYYLDAANRIKPLAHGRRCVFCS